MRSMFDRPDRRDRRLEEFVALCASRSALARGYTRVEHDEAMDLLLADLAQIETARAPGKQIDPPDIVVHPVYEEDEDDSRLFLTLAC